MAEQLQRSVTTFRRSGSSGLVWDERLIFSDHRDPDKEEADVAGELRNSRRASSVGMMARSRSAGSGGRQGLPFRAAVVQPSMDPPSPELPRCCGLIFTKRRSAKISRRR
ncbi:MAPK kinase substrate protein At1g80180-like [Curcuma longa]|uniref:MAPK kinase substrate protein At1g80180-like n=1 Tax=Curcuma longa TaxID=136217 RepID=UPI003D9DC119